MPSQPTLPAHPGASPPTEGRPSTLCWLVAASILVACWMPARRMPVEEAAGVALVPHLDKALHFAMFALYGCGVMLGGKRSAMLWLGVVLAAVSELGQAIPLVGRDASFGDAGADLAGLVSGAWLAHARRRR